MEFIFFTVRRIFVIFYDKKNFFLSLKYRELHKGPIVLKVQLHTVTNNFHYGANAEIPKKVTRFTQIVRFIHDWYQELTFHIKIIIKKENTSQCQNVTKFPCAYIN